MNIFTIGFSGKTAEIFFQILVKNNIAKLIDVRLNNKSQLAGFTNIKHLPYLLKIHNIKYEHMLDLAPSAELLDLYKKNKITWSDYEKKYIQILQDRKILKNLDIKIFDNCVLLCSEPTSDKCHRRVLAEYLQNNFKNIKIEHL
ncbi:DUF488 domain-containing protein [Campylobacter peloridis]|uniref:DUF488 domain-containing protein n=1 Tax=Campylobacter peloridis TaxID=488546 RepID=A0A5C7E123_9BACT|nr:DUF488 domain-containing protein [Campylobacter peloridis]TXE83245.1 DUF488 domain-containing protein [Campylobacter peloridis]